MAACGRLLVVSVRLLVACSRLFVVCGRLWSFAGGLWSFTGGLWLFMVVACFINYEERVYVVDFNFEYL